MIIHILSGPGTGFIHLNNEPDDKIIEGITTGVLLDAQARASILVNESILKSNDEPSMAEPSRENTEQQLRNGRFASGVSTSVIE